MNDTFVTIGRQFIDNVGSYSGHGGYGGYCPEGRVVNQFGFCYKNFSKKLPKFQSCVVLKEIDFFATNFGTRCCRPLIFHTITFVREIV